MAKVDQDDKIKKLDQDHNIMRSKKINACRLKKMEERNKCINEMKKYMVTQLQDQMQNNRSRYLDTIKQLILQGMIKLLEPKLLIKCREEDSSEIEGMLGDIQEEYYNFMHEKTGREYKCELEVFEEHFGDEKDQGCGGIILYTENSRIVVPNLLVNRLELCYEEMLPLIRRELFPEAPRK